MLIKRHLLALCLATLTACSNLPVTRLPLADLWLDAAFDYQATLVRVDQDALFQLDAEALAILRNPQVQNSSPNSRIKYLISFITEPRGKAFLYSNGPSTVAAQTWNSRRGDCLSLTVLAYAMARELHLQASMQEVPVPASIDRRGGIDFEVGHVNLYIDTGNLAYLSANFGGRRGVVIDFQPTIGSTRQGDALTPLAMLARFDNNLGAQSLADGDLPSAYAHFKAAIQADPEFSLAYLNLAALYRRTGHDRNAEKILLHAAALTGNSHAAIRGLHQLMVAQGRTEEAASYQQILLRQRDQDPYYWIGVGMDQFAQQNFQRAIDAFEHAQSLTTGFAEVHRYLAMAYLKTGQAAKFEEQLVALQSIDRNDPSIRTLSNKLESLH